MKTIIKQIATDYNVNQKALKRYVKASGLETKKATRLEVLEILYIHCTELFYCRAEDDGTVEYLDTDRIVKLCKEHKRLKEVQKTVDFFIGGAK